MRKLLICLALFITSTVPAYGAVKRVAASGDNSDGTTWAKAYHSLQTALGAISSGDEIWVKAGTYTPDVSNRSASFVLVSGAGVYGGFAGTETSRSERSPSTNFTILSGDLNDDDEGSVVDSSHEENSYNVVRSSGNSSTILDGFTITAGYADTWSGTHGFGGGLYETGSTTVVNCLFEGNVALAGGGAYTEGDGSTFIRCKFHGNYAGDGGAVWATYNNSFYNCIFNGNLGGDAVFSTANDLKFINCLFSGNDETFSPTIFVMLSNTMTITNSTILGSVIADIGTNELVMTNSIVWDGDVDGFTTETVTYSCIDGGHTGTGNISSDPLFLDPEGEDEILGTLDDNLHLHAASPAINAGSNAALPDDLADLDGDSITGEDLSLDLDDRTRVMTSTVDMGAYEHFIFFVADSGNDSTGLSWANAYNSPQSALDDVVAGDEIWVKAGTYHPSYRFDPWSQDPTPGDAGSETFLLVSGVDMYGGFAGTETLRTQRDPANNETILSGDLNDDDDNSGFPTQDTNYTNTHDDNSYPVVSSLVYARTILDGFTVSGGIQNRIDPYCGGGIYDFGDTIVVNCQFTGNYAWKGGGVGTNHGTYVNCKIYRNYSFTSDDTCGAINLEGYGDGSSNASFYNCIVYDNAYGAVFAYGYGEAVNAHFVNCVFNENNSGPARVSVLTIYPVNITYTNCTLRGGDMRSEMFGYGTSDLVMTNCILRDGEIANEFTSTTVTYSDIEGGYSGTGNISSDPLFVDTDNLRLQGTSPAINAGSNAALPDDLADLDGNLNTGEDLPLDFDYTDRVKYSTVDMGAYEYAWAMTAARSCRTHSSAGEFCIPLSLEATGTVEPRLNGPQKVVVGFNSNIDAGSTPSVTLSNGTLDSTSINGNELTIVMHGVTDVACLDIDIAGVTDEDGNGINGNNDVHIVAISGDVDQDGLDEFSGGSGDDYVYVNSHLNENADAYNFLGDLNCSGVITTTDRNIAWLHGGHTASCP